MNGSSANRSLTVAARKDIELACHVGKTGAAVPHERIREQIGTSVEGRAIELFSFSCGRHPVLILAGMHGDEPKGVALAQRLIEGLAAEPSDCAAVVVPIVNPDGYQVRRRRNAAGVDINRNFPTADWVTGPRRSRFYPGPKPASEPETRAIMALVEHGAPAGIVAIHSISRHRFCNNYDGPGRGLAMTLAKCNGYPIRSSIGYATPGSFGTWAGRERGLPTVTLELASHHSTRRCWADNRDALLAICRKPA